jgi:hypothetical protein
MYSLFALAILCQACISQNSINASTEIFTLSPPQINATSIFFDSITTVQLSFDFPNAVIKYSLKGDAVNHNSKVYSAPLELTEGAVIKARVYHPDYLASEEVQVEVVKTSTKKTIQKITFTPSASENYPGLGAEGLGDLIKGAEQFGGDKQWMGFQTDSISAAIKLNSNIEVSTLVLSVLTNQSNWIFAPAKIEVYNEGVKVGVLSNPNSAIETSSRATFLSVPITKGIYSEFTVVVYPLSEIPDWHQGKGTTPWLFIDEIIIQ